MTDPATHTTRRLVIAWLLFTTAVLVALSPWIAPTFYAEASNQTSLSSDDWQTIEQAMHEACAQDRCIPDHGHGWIHALSPWAILAGIVIPLGVIVLVFHRLKQPPH